MTLPCTPTPYRSPYTTQPQNPNWTFEATTRQILLSPFPLNHSTFYLFSPSTYACLEEHLEEWDPVITPSGPPTLLVRSLHCLPPSMDVLSPSYLTYSTSSPPGVLYLTHSIESTLVKDTSDLHLDKSNDPSLVLTLPIPGMECATLTPPQSVTCLPWGDVDLVA